MNVSPFRNNLDNYDFPKKVMDTLYNYPLEQVNSLKHVADIQQGNDSDITTAALDHSEDSVGNKQSSQDETEPQAVCNNDIANSEEQNSLSQTGSLENLSKQEISVDGSSENQAGTDSTIDNVESGNKSSTSTRADRWIKKRHKPYKDRVEAKLNKAREIEAARNIIQQKNVDW